MKKLVLALAVIASVSMISCTNTATETTEAPAEDTTVVEQVETPADSTVTEVADSTAAPTQEAAPEEAPAEPAK